MSDRRQAPSTQTNQCLRSAQSVSFINLLLSSAFLSALMSCDMLQNNVQVTRAPSVATTLSKISPIAAKPNEVVSLTGRNFSETKSLKVSLALANGLRTSIPLTIKDSENASFVMPDGAGLGLKEASLTQGTSQLEVVKFNLIADQAVNQLPIWIGDASEICTTREYIDRNGDTKTGTKDCSALVLTPACTANGVVGCVTNDIYKSADLTNLLAGNIKSSVVIAGVTGDYPSESHRLEGSSGTDLTAATFNAQIKSSATFQYFGSDGVRYTGTGDADIVDSNIKSSEDIFGTIGNVMAAVAPDPWNVRVGTTINGVTGKLKVNCRNRVRTAVYNYDGAIGSIGQGGWTNGTALDIWDTIDDYNNNVAGLPSDIVTAWGSNTSCGGVDDPSLSTDDDNVWKDVTTTSDGAASNCATDAARCAMQDKITGLWWSKLQANAAWNTAWSNCQSLNYNGKTGWRLPTQKELMEAYGHGIRSAVSASWITQSGVNNWFWSGSSNSSSSSNAWGVNLSNGYTLNTSITCGVNAYVSKSSTNWYVCVR